MNLIIIWMDMDTGKSKARYVARKRRKSVWKSQKIRGVKSRVYIYVRNDECNQRPKQRP